MEGRAAFSEALKESHGLSEVPSLDLGSIQTTIYQPAITSYHHVNQHIATACNSYHINQRL
jgi:hypothetical protein